MFFCEICEIFKNTYFEEYLRKTASVVSFSWLYVHYLRHKIYQPKIKCQDEGSYFYKNQKSKPLEIEKNIFTFRLTHFRKF